MTTEQSQTQYAIIQTGSKQYRVSPGDLIDVEYLPADFEEEVLFEDVLLFHDGNTIRLGAPSVPTISVKGKIVDFALGPKVIALKYKRRKKSRKKIGHRQGYHRVEILEIVQ